MAAFFKALPKEKVLELKKTAIQFARDYWLDTEAIVAMMLFRDFQDWLNERAKAEQKKQQEKEATSEVPG
jgi:uncharacterized protein YdaU (DUF1376 family)